ncbi:MAG: SseB family protein [Lachnospiraceae bacterium]|nr:SseB family protein [Lachnospiraceae bacterium]
MAELDDLAKKFAAERNNDNFAKLMTVLEKSLVFVPALRPDNMTDEELEEAKQGKNVPIKNGTKLSPLVLMKKDGTRAMPVYTSKAEIPQDKAQISPVLLNIPFEACVDMAFRNPETVVELVVNPFTDAIGLNRKFVEMQTKRYEALKQNNAAKQLTPEQIYAGLHVKVGFEMLPKALFQDVSGTMGRIKAEKNRMLHRMYLEAAGKGRGIPYAEDDFSVMSLSITDDLEITRIDLPEKHQLIGCPVSVFITIKDGNETGYYVIQKVEGKKVIVGVDASLARTVIEDAPENGTELETIMSLALPQ